MDMYWAAGFIGEEDVGNLTYMRAERLGLLAGGG